jgi:hypothetical protein
MIRVWSEAAGDPLRADRAAVYDWGRRQAARLLRGRPVGDPDIDGLVLLAVVEAFGSVPRQPADVDAAVHVLESGFLAADPAG